MNHFRSPQALSPVALNIGSPRSLRPREELPPAPQFYPQTPQTVYVSAFTPQLRPNEELEDSPPIQYVAEPRIDELELQGTSSGWRAGRMGGLVNRLRRIPGAMAKHHSRESLHAQYREEAVQYAQHYPGHVPSQALSDIPETFAESPSDPPASYEIYDDGTTAVHHEQEFGQMPQAQLGIQPSYSDSQSDSRLSKAESLSLPLPPKDTWMYYWTMILLFIHHIRNLPWMDVRIVNDYVPARDGRGGYGARKPANSWYKPRGRGGDTEKATIPPQLYVVPATPPTASVVSSTYMGPPQPVMAMQSPYSEATTAIRPTRTALTVSSSGMSMMSPGASSHGLGRQEVSYSWYSSSPQQFPWQYPPVYESEMSTPQTHTAGGYFVPH